VKESQPEPPKIIKPSPEAVETVKESKHKIVVKTDLVRSNEKQISDAKAAAEKQARQAAAERRRLAAALGRATRDLKSGLSSGTDIKFNDGFGGSGPAYANWLQIVKSIYFNDWSGRVPEGATDDSAMATASVIIARDGTVISSHITQTSGNSAVDKSIQETLDRVRFTAPFPENAGQDQRELEITFSVKALKQLTG
jgi:TonB family protein